MTTQRDASGAVVGFVGLAHDITARHQSEQALRKSEERFRALSEHAPVGIVQTDEHGSCWYANRRFCELAGRSEGEVRGTGWIEALSGHDPPACSTAGRTSSAQGRVFDSEFLVDRPDGTAVHLRATAGPIRADDGRVTGFVITTQDISERVGAQRRLSESEQLFRDTLENVALAAAQLDAARPRRLLQPAPGRRCSAAPPAAVVGLDWFAEIVPAGALVDAGDLRADDARRDRAAPPREPDRHRGRRAAGDQLVDHRPPRRRRHGGRRHLARRGRDRAAPGRAARLAPGLPRRPHRAARTGRRSPITSSPPSPRPSAARPRSRCSSATSTRSSS